MFHFSFSFGFELEASLLLLFRDVKREATITAEVLRPRYLRTCQTSTSNRAKEQDSDWTVPKGLARDFFFYCIAELAIKPCRSSRSNTRGGFEKFHDTCKTGNKNTTKQTKTPKQTNKIVNRYKSDEPKYRTHNPGLRYDRKI